MKIHTLTKQQIEFIKKYKKFAEETERKSGISALFILAQAGLESRWGVSTPGNMFFGVKAKKDTPANKKQLLVTHEVLKTDKEGYRFPAVLEIKKRADGKFVYKVKDWFMKYDTPEECFTDHANFFYRNKRYSKALEVKSNPYRFAEEIAAAGYATGTNYAEKLKLIIENIEKCEIK